MASKEEKELEILIRAAHAGGEVLRKYFGQALDVLKKSSVADFQTKADLESEKAILKILKTEFPTYNIVSEEEGETNKDSDYTLVIDPLDGTNNFVLGMPTFSVSIGLLYKNEGIAGVAYQPIIDQTFSATKGGGAYKNGKRIQVNKITETKNLNVIVIFSYLIQQEKEYLSQTMKSLYRSDCKRIITNWSGAFEYCMLASGKVESVITDDIELHDYAAGKLIALEAGAKIVDFSGGEEKEYVNNKFIMSNTSEVNKYIFNIIKPVIDSR